MGCSDVEVRLEVLLPATVLLAAGVIEGEPSKNVKDVEEPEEVADEIKPGIAEPLATAIVVASSSTAPLRLPEDRVVVEVRL